MNIVFCAIMQVLKVEQSCPQELTNEHHSTAVVENSRAIRNLFIEIEKLREDKIPKYAKMIDMYSKIIDLYAEYDNSCFYQFEAMLKLGELKELQGLSPKREILELFKAAYIGCDLHHHGVYHAAIDDIAVMFLKYPHEMKEFVLNTMNT